MRRSDVASELPGAMSRCGVYVYAQEKRYRRQTLPELTLLLKKTIRISGDEILPVNVVLKPPAIPRFGCSLLLCVSFNC